MRETVFAVEMADRSAVVVTGSERTSWLNGLVTCDLATLPPGDAAYGLVVEKKGKIQTDFFGVPGTDALALAVPRHLRESVHASLDHYLIMEDAELALDELVFWQLHGPLAAEIAERLEQARYRGKLDRLGSGGAIVAAPTDQAAALASRIAAECTSRGGVIGDEPGWEALRIERGLPRFGVEVDTTLYPQEASLEKLAVSFSKGCYLGQEVVYMLENRGHVKKKLVPLDVDGDAPLAKGDAVTTPEGDAIGEVRSSVIGPTTNRVAAIAMVKWAKAKPGTELRAGGQVARVRPH